MTKLQELSAELHVSLDEWRRGGDAQTEKVVKAVLALVEDACREEAPDVAVELEPRRLIMIALQDYTINPHTRQLLDRAANILDPGREFAGMDAPQASDCRLHNAIDACRQSFETLRAIIMRQA